MAETGIAASRGATTGADDQSYRFTLWVCDVADALARSRSFMYRGIDLQYAFKRATYFALINDPAAYEVFLAEQRGERSQPPAGPTAASEVLAAYLSPHAPSQAAPMSFSDKALNLARRAAAALLRPARAGAVWMIAIQPKFVLHLEPVMEGLDESYRIVTFDDPLTDDFLRDRGYLSLNAGSSTFWQTGPLRAVPNEIGVVATLALAYDAVFRILWENAPKGIVLSEGNAPIYEIVNLAARKLRIPTICVQQGWSPIVHSGFRDMSFSSMVVWGDWFAQALLSHNPAQHMFPLGNHMIELAPARTGRPRTIGFFLQVGSRLISDEAWSGMLGLIEFCARELPGVRVLVREHPNGPLTMDERARLGALPAVELVPPGEITLQSVLRRCDVVVSIFSTTILEGIGVGAVPLVVNATSMPSYYPDVAAEGAGIEVKDFAGARDALRMFWSQGTARYAAGIAAMQRRLFAHGGAEALARIVSHVRSEFGLLPGAGDAAQLRSDP